jgi:hypothetical protein
MNLSYGAALVAICGTLSGTGWGQEAASDPWAPGELLRPAELAGAIQSGKAPIVVSVAFPILYRGKHIVHAINGGPGSKPEGIEALKNAVAKLPRDADNRDLLWLLSNAKVSQHPPRLSNPQGSRLYTRPHTQLADEFAHRLG